MSVPLHLRHFVKLWNLEAVSLWRSILEPDGERFYIAMNPHEAGIQSPLGSVILDCPTEDLFQGRSGFDTFFNIANGRCSQFTEVETEDGWMLVASSSGPAMGHAHKLEVGEILVYLDKSWGPIRYQTDTLDRYLDDMLPSGRLDEHYFGEPIFPQGKKYRDLAILKESNNVVVIENRDLKTYSMDNPVDGHIEQTNKNIGIRPVAIGSDPEGKFLAIADEAGQRIVIAQIDPFSRSVQVNSATDFIQTPSACPIDLAIRSSVISDSPFVASSASGAQ